MAYRELGLTNEQLRERYYRESGNLTPAEIVVRFGRPRDPSREDLAPYDFLEADPLSPNALRSYGQLPAPDYIDATGRQYSKFGRSNPRYLYVRLSKGKTAKENAENVPFFQRQDFPRPGDELVLTNARPLRGRKRPSSAFDGDGGEIVSATVSSVIFRRTATALVEVDRSVYDYDDDYDGDADEENQGTGASGDGERSDSRTERKIEKHSRRLNREREAAGVSEEDASEFEGIRYERTKRAEKRPRQTSSIRAPSAPFVRSAASSFRCRKFGM